MGTLAAGGLRVAVGSANPVKVEGVKKALKALGIEAEVLSLEVPSGVPPIPFGDEVFEGARNRAAGACERVEADLCVGPESGLFVMHGRLFMVSVVAVTDKRELRYGLSPGFEIPERWAKRIMEDPSAFFEFMEYMGGKDLGRRGGLVGELTRGVIRRSDFCSFAAIMAISALLNERWR